MTNDNLNKLCLEMRRDIITATYKSGKGGAHAGGALSCVEILAVLYTRFMSEGISLESRDRFIMSKGHGALALYSILKHHSKISKEEFDSFDQDGSVFCAHPKRDIAKGIEFSGGSLGLGISFAVGVAYACEEKKLNNHIYVLVGDGECNEGIVWEALASIAHYKLSDITIIVDHNHLQVDGRVEDVMNMEPLEDKFTSFGCYVQVADGHSIESLTSAFNARIPNRINVIIAETIKGKGCSFMENKASWHHNILSEGRYIKAMKELEE